MKRKNDFDNAITAAFDGMTAEETDALLSGVDSADESGSALDALRLGARKKAGLGTEERSFDRFVRAKKTRRSLAPRARRLLAAAAVLVFLIGAALGGTAYAAEAKEYNEALGFFNENQLPTEGLSRKEIKEVYRRIVVERLSGSDNNDVINVGQYTFDVSGIEFDEHPASDKDFRSLWKQHSLDSVPANDDEFIAWTYGGLLSLYDDGVHYIRTVEYEDDNDSVGVSVLEKYKRNECELRYSVDYSTFDAFEVFDDCLIAVGTRTNDSDIGINTIMKVDNEGNVSCSSDNYLGSRQIFSILEDGERNYLVFAYQNDNDGHRISMFRFSKYYLKLISETEFDYPAGYYPVRATRFGSGYALLLQATLWDWEASHGDMARQIIAFVSDEGKLTGSVPAALDSAARETLMARETEDLAPDDPAALLSVDLDDSCFVIVDMLEYGGKLYFSGYALPKGRYYCSDEPNPSSHHDEIMPLFWEVFDSLPSEEEFTPLLREYYTAMLLEFDPASETPTAFCLEAGALGNSLREDDSGRLVWNVCSIQRGVFSIATSAYTVRAYTAVYEYRFAPSGAVIAADTGARTMFMR